MLVSVQYARAAAALLVVVGHMSGFPIFNAITSSDFGGFGVDLFFVISGFIMWETSEKQFPSEFIQRRIARIVPPYWFYTTLLVCLAVFLPSQTPNIEISAKELLGSYLFIPYTDHRGLQNPLLLQGWTLNIEMYFYVVFALSLFIPSRRARFVAIAALFLASIPIGIAAGRDIAIISRLTSPILLEFVLGMAVSAIWQRVKIAPPAALLMAIAGAATLVYFGTHQPAADIRYIVFGIPAAFLLYGLVNLEGHLSRRPWRLLVSAGDASYSLYLCHPFILSIVNVVLSRAGTRYLGLDGVALGLTFGVTAIVVALIASYLSFIFIEKPSARFMRRQFFGGKKDDRKAPVAAA